MSTCIAKWMNQKIKVTSNLERREYNYKIYKFYIEKIENSSLISTSWKRYINKSVYMKIIDSLGEGGSFF